MKRIFFLTCLLISSLTILAIKGANYSVGSTQVAFIENKGQMHDQNCNLRPDVLFGAKAQQMTFHLRTTGVSYQLNRIDKWKDVEDLKTKQKKQEILQQTIYRVDLNWLNARVDYTISKDEAIPDYNNYYLENCPDGALNVKSYKGITLHNLYNGINLHYYQKKGELKHDYIVSPHINYKQIQVKVEGASVQTKSDGGLILNTPLGKIEEGKPVVYQNGKILKAIWVLKNNILSFEIENYNPDIELIIDPVTRLWGTYYSGSNDDWGYACATDNMGNVYMSGESESFGGTEIATVGSHQQTAGGSNEAFVVQFNSNGQRQWGTYYGGSVNDYGTQCATDPLGNIYLTGHTNSNIGTAIATIGSHQQIHGGGGPDAFLVKFNNSGIRQWGTYYGGNGADYANSVAIDGTGNVFLAGYTDSGLGIATAGCHQQTYGGGIYDSFIVKFNSNGQRQWGTYYGGSAYDIFCAMATDLFGNVCMVGYTGSNTGTIIATTGSHQQTYGGGIYDAFVVQFNGSGQRQWGTYYGALGHDYGNALTTDATGNIYFGGYTAFGAGTIIATVGSYQQNYGGGTYDAFLVKFNNNGQRQWGTYYGGNGIDYSSACAMDPSGNIFLSGHTNSGFGTVIATSGSHQQTFAGGVRDGYLAKFDSNGQRQWGTYYGGSGNDFGHFCTTDSFGDVYLSGTTDASIGTVIATPGSHQQNYGGGAYDAYLVKFKSCAALNPSASVNSPVCINAILNFSASISGTATPTYSWSGPNTYTSAVQNPTIINASILNSGIYTVNIINGVCIETATAQAIVDPSPTISVNSGSICSGNLFTITPMGANTYSIQGGNSIVSPTVNTTYSVIGTSSIGCIGSNTAICSITVNITPSISVNSGSICYGNSFTIIPVGANSYTIEGNNTIVSPTINTTYTVIGTSSLGCLTPSASICNVSVIALPIISVNNGSICTGDSFTLTPIGADTYTFIGGGPIVSPTISGSYSVAGANFAGCIASAFAVSNITVNLLPALNVSTTNTMICVGESVTLTVTGANSYTWSSGVIGTSISVNPTITTTYSIDAISIEGCYNSITLVQDVSSCTGIKTNEETLELRIYPNPTTGKILINHKTPWLSYEVFNSLGQKIFVSSIITKIGIELDLSLQPNGIYFVKMGSTTRRVIKE